jgi:hypothetical protein
MKKLLLSLLFIVAIFPSVFAQNPGSVYPGSIDTRARLGETANNAFSTLAAQMTASDTTATLVNASKFASTGFITIGSEIISYSGKSGNQLIGLIRGEDGTAASSHVAGNAVEMRVVSKIFKIHADALIAIETKLGAGADINATKLQGRSLANTAPTDGQGVIWSASNNRWQPGTVAGGGGAVESVFGRTGIVVPVANDYTWAQVNKTTSSLADITTRSYADLQGVPSTFAPAAHAASHGSAGSDPVTIAESQVTNLVSDLGGLAPKASPIFTGVVTIPTPFTLGAVSVTATGTELNFSVGVTSSIQTQIDGKQASLGFTAENTANRRTTFQVTPDDTHYASEKLVKDSLDAKQASLGFTAVPNTRTVNGHALNADVAVTPTDLGLVIGTNVQAFDTELSAIAGLVSAADKLPYFTGSGTAGVADFTAFGRSLIDDANAAAGRSTLGLVIGTDVAATGAIGSSGLTMSTARLLGRSTASSGAIEEITIGSGLSLSGGSLSATGSVSGANPTASVGLTPVNGSASTYLRSDGAPALDVSIAPTWTGIHTWGAGLARMTSPRVTTSIFDTNGLQVLGLTATASAVNSITVGNEASGSNPFLQSNTNVINIRNSTNPQTLRLFSAYTSESNYARLSFEAGSGYVGIIVSEATSTALANSTFYITNDASGGAIQLRSGNGNHWDMSAAGHIVATPDNALDIGASAATRPRTGYFGTSLVSPKFFTTSTVFWSSGSGTPESAVTAPIGSLYTRTDGGANTTLYVKESGSGNTGWVAK